MHMRHIVGKGFHHLNKFRFQSYKLAIQSLKGWAHQAKPNPMSHFGRTVALRIEVHYYPHMVIMAPPAIDLTRPHKHKLFCNFY